MIIYIIPIISALIGWFTNFIAVKMLFHPRREIHFLFFKIQGLIPSRKADLASKIGEIVNKEIISHEKIIEAINDIDEQGKIKILLGQKIDHFIQHKLLAMNPMFAMFLQGSVADAIKESLINEFMEMMPELIEQLTSDLGNKIDFKEIVKEKINQFDIDKFEEIVFKIADKELKHIELYGAILGFVIGLVQVVLVKLFL